MPIMITTGKLTFIMTYTMPMSFLASDVQMLDNAIQRINRYAVDKFWKNKPRYPLDNDLSGGSRYLPLEQLACG